MYKNNCQYLAMANRVITTWLLHCCKFQHHKGGLEKEKFNLRGRTTALNISHAPYIFSLVKSQDNLTIE